MTADERGITPVHMALFKGQLSADDIGDGSLLKEKTKTVLASQHYFDQDRMKQVTGPENATDLGSEILLEAGATPLHLACYLGDVEAAKLLLEHKAQATAKTKGNATPLHYATRNGHQKLCELIIAQKRVKVDAPISTQSAPNFYDAGMTPLCCAAESGDLSTVELLLEKGADPKVVTKGGCSTLLFAARGNSPEITSRLIKAGANAKLKVGFRSHPLHEAVVRHNSEIVSILLKAGADPHGGTRGKKSPSGNPLANPLWRDALRTGQQEVLQLLSQYGVSPRIHDSIRSAVSFNDIEDVKKRLKGGETLTSGRSSGLTICAVEGFPEMMQVLLEAGADPNDVSEGYSALHVACDPTPGRKKWRFSQRSFEERCLENASFLLKAGADPNVRDRHGNGPLWTAVRCGFIEMVKLLLQHGAKASEKTLEFAHRDKSLSKILK